MGIASSNRNGLVTITSRNLANVNNANGAIIVNGASGFVGACGPTTTSISLSFIAGGLAKHNCRTNRFTFRVANINCRLASTDNGGLRGRIVANAGNRPSISNVDRIAFAPNGLCFAGINACFRGVIRGSANGNNVTCSAGINHLAIAIASSGNALGTITRLIGVTGGRLRFIGACAIASADRAFATRGRLVNHALVGSRFAFRLTRTASTGNALGANNTILTTRGTLSNDVAFPTVACATTNACCCIISRIAPANSSFNVRCSAHQCTVALGMASGNTNTLVTRAPACGVISNTTTSDVLFRGACGTRSARMSVPNGGVLANHI